TAVHVDAIPIPAEPVAISQRLHGEGFVCFDEIVITDRGAGLLHEILHCENWRKEQILRIATTRGVRGDARHDVEAVRLRVFLGRDDERGTTIVETWCIAGRD